MKFTSLKKSSLIAVLICLFVSCSEKLFQPLTSNLLAFNLEESKLKESWNIKPKLHEVVFVVHGGFNSCADNSENVFGLDPNLTDFYPQFKNLIAQVSDEYPESVPRVLIGCLTTESPIGGKTYYRWNKQPIPRTTQTQNLGTMIRNEIKDYRAPIFFIGHSYGAWLAMKLILELGNDFNIAGLYTIDPISPNDCSPMRIISENEGCFKSPSDISYIDVLNKTKNWHNFYQNSDPWLQSSKISLKKVQNYNFYYTNGGHRIIDSDTRVWSQITLTVKEYLAKIYK